mgnify:CR=1 FL=1
MECGFEAVLAGQRVLQFFYLRVNDFNVVPAVFTNEMIMVSVGGMLIAGQSHRQSQHLTAKPPRTKVS